MQRLLSLLVLFAIVVGIAATITQPSVASASDGTTASSYQVRIVGEYWNIAYGQKTWKYSGRWEGIPWCPPIVTFKEWVCTPGNQHCVLVDMPYSWVPSADNSTCTVEITGP